ncbi:DsbA family protein [Halosimplex salinum]|uniref:DsbA family protein n=1 Tax=Halosimplex salinum TaxID=1710538 RepID=UPI000F498369|nr:thioredoxin domain-containing protein [Halosimplex salinum]
MEERGRNTGAPTRRRFLAGAAASVAAGLAGCSGLVTGQDDGDLATTADASLSTPTLGADDAPVTVGVYKDFACPACAQFNEQITPLIERDYVEEGVVRYEHYDFPLDMHDPESYTAANAARAVQDLAGDDAFFAFADALFANQSDQSPGTYAELAGDVDVEGDRVRSAAEGRTYRHVVSADKDRGLDEGVRGTPTVVVDGSIVDELSWEGIRSDIEAARPDGG